jgi:probable metal-binding protein
MTNATIAEPIYGHEVLTVLASLGGSADLEMLRAAVVENFGKGAVFCNCAGNRFAFDELLGFLASRGKLAIAGDRLSLGPVPGCDGH